MFAKIENGIVVEWPIPSIAELFPNTSFPAPLTNADLPEGYVMVGVIPPPVVGPNQSVTPGAPVFQNGEWVQSWDLVNLTSQETAERNAVKAADARAERNRLLADSDWTQLADAPVDKAAWAQYRQALRDITTQTDFPSAIQWPLQPI